MKILRVTRTMDPSHGGVVEAINQATSVSNDGYNSMDVVCLDDANSEWILETRNHNIFALGKAYTSYGIHFKFLKWIWNNSQKYDIVVFDGLWQFILISGYLLRFLKVPYCVFPHGMLDPYFNNDKLKFIKKLPFWILVERNIIASANATIFTCHEESILASTSFPFYSSNSVVASLGVEVPSVRESSLINEFYHQYPKLKDKKFALFLSRLHPKKGVDLLVKALAEMNDIPEDFCLVVAGPDHCGLKRKLMTLVAQKNIQDKVVWLDMLKGNLKWGAFYCADVFILPSHQENFGIVVAEALGTGTPVLITDKINIWSYIKLDSAGLVDSDDLAGVKRLLNSWFQFSIESKLEMKKSALRCFEKNFSKDVSKKSLEKVFKNIMRT